MTKILKSTQNVWLKRLRANSNMNIKLKSTRKCPIIAVTAHTDNETVENAKQAGVETVIFKPVSHNELWRALKKYYIF